MLHSYISKQVSEGEGAIFKTSSNGMNGGHSNGCGNSHLDECSCAQLFVMLRERNTRVLQNYSMLSTCYVKAIDTRCVCVCVRSRCGWSSLVMFTVATLSSLLENLLHKVKCI